MVIVSLSGDMISIGNRRQHPLLDSDHFTSFIRFNNILNNSELNRKLLRQGFCLIKSCLKQIP